MFDSQQYDIKAKKLSELDQAYSSAKNHLPAASGSNKQNQVIEAITDGESWSEKNKKQLSNSLKAKSIVVSNVIDAKPKNKSQKNAQLKFTKSTSCNLKALTIMHKQFNMMYSELCSCSKSDYQLRTILTDYGGAKAVILSSPVSALTGKVGVIVRWAEASSCFFIAMLQDIEKNSTSSKGCKVIRLTKASCTVGIYLPSKQVPSPHILSVDPAGHSFLAVQ